MTRPVLFLAIALITVAAASASSLNTGEGFHDFDYQFGTWNVRVSRFLRPESRWVTYTGTHTVTPLWNGHANIGVLEIHGSAGRIEGLQLRLYDPATQRWSLSFASSADGELQHPSVGRFHGKNATFFDNEVIDGKPALVRTESTVTTSREYCDVSAYSLDRGKHWTTVWIANYEKQ